MDGADGFRLLGIQIRWQVRGGMARLTAFARLSSYYIRFLYRFSLDRSNEMGCYQAIQLHLLYDRVAITNHCLCVSYAVLVFLFTRRLDRRCYLLSS